MKAVEHGHIHEFKYQVATTQPLKRVVLVKVCWKPKSYADAAQQGKGQLDDRH